MPRGYGIVALAHLRESNLGGILRLGVRKGKLREIAGHALRDRSTAITASAAPWPNNTASN